jgi:hypothetical protein
MYMDLFDDELNTIIAALRFYQEAGMGDPFERPDWLNDIACPTVDSTSLSDEEIDRLCEYLQTLVDVDQPCIVDELVETPAEGCHREGA